MALAASEMKSEMEASMSRFANWAASGGPVETLREAIPFMRRCKLVGDRFWTALPCGVQYGEFLDIVAGHYREFEPFPPSLIGLDCDFAGERRLFWPSLVRQKLPLGWFRASERTALDPNTRRPSAASAHVNPG